VEPLETEVARARTGDRGALESVLRAVQKDVYDLALRFLWHPQDAEDATQEILVRVLTGLGGFRGESRFRTWVYRIACNALLTARRQRMERQPMSFEAFGQDLAQGLSDKTDDDVENKLLLEEVKIGCTLAMLLCLDRERRLAYILGEILELDHNEAGEVLAVSPAVFRKRLSQARSQITSFMLSRCGLADAANACRCRKRVDAAVALGRVDPARLLFASSQQQARGFPKVLAEIRRLDDTRRAAALYRAHPDARPSGAFTAWLKRVIADTPG
jgi:RNA polymerase sigma factor (sigma-70 family)